MHRQIEHWSRPLRAALYAPTRMIFAIPAMPRQLPPALAAKRAAPDTVPTCARG